MLRACAASDRRGCERAARYHSGAVPGGAGSPAQICRRACAEAVVQAAAPARLIEGGLPTEALVAQVPREAEAGPLQGDEGPFGGPRIVPWYMKISHAAGVTFKEPLAAVERLEGAGPHVANLVPVSGMSGSKAGSIIGLVAPIVMNGIRQQAGGLDASKITDLLSSQKDFIAAAVPAGLAGMLSNSDVLSDVQSTGSSAAARPNRAAKTSRFGLRGAADPSAPARSEMNRLAWVIPLALVLGGLWYFLGDRKDNQPTIPTAQTTTTTTAATSTGAIPDSSAEVTTAIASLRTTLQGITDSASAKAALPRLQEADGLLNAVNDRCRTVARPEEGGGGARRNNHGHAH